VLDFVWRVRREVNFGPVAHSANVHSAEDRSAVYGCSAAAAPLETSYFRLNCFFLAILESLMRKFQGAAEQENLSFQSDAVKEKVAVFT